MASTRAVTSLRSEAHHAQQASTCCCPEKGNVKNVNLSPTLFTGTYLSDIIGLMDAWKHQRFSVLILATALLALILLATLQYYWLGQVSVGERERLQASLQVGATRFAEEFDRELARIYLSFQIDAATMANRSWSRYAERYERWFASAPYPQLVDDVFLVQVSQLGQLRLSVYNPATSRFETSSWPAALATLRSDLQRSSAALRQNSSLPDTVTLEPSAADIPALVIPLSRVWILSDQQAIDINADLLFAERALNPAPPVCTSCRTTTPETVFAYTIVTLNQAYLQQEFIPNLAQRHLALGHLDYNLAIVSRNNDGHIWYRSDSPDSPLPQNGDATINFFGVHFDDLNRLLLADDLRLEEPPLDDKHTTEHVRIGILGTTNQPGNTYDGNWQLIATHQAGSLEAAVTGLLQRNLIISFSILLVLTVSVIMMVVWTQRAQRLAAQKLEFAAAISHELRTPIAVICSAGENLADGIIHDLPQARQYGALIRTEGRRLSDMVEQALEFAGVHSGRQTYDLRVLDVEQLVLSAISSYQAQITSERFVVEHIIQPNVPPILGDLPALRRSLHNLLANAMKYSDSRRWIEVAAYEVNTSGGSEVQISVRDCGIGIAPRDIPHIFEPFYRGRNAIAAQIHGSGLGLSLVRHVIDAHAGRISVESVPGHGSTFIIHLPSVAASTVAHNAQIEGNHESAHLAH